MEKLFHVVYICIISNEVLILFVFEAFLTFIFTDKFLDTKTQTFPGFVLGHEGLNDQWLTGLKQLFNLKPNTSLKENGGEQKLFPMKMSLERSSNRNISTFITPLYCI